jgi:hypothetical protein
VEWRRLAREGAEAEMTPEQRENMRALGYIQ